MAYILGSRANACLMRTLQHVLQTTLYFLAVASAELPVHLQMLLIQLMLQHLPLLHRIATLYTAGA